MTIAPHDFSAAFWALETTSDAQLLLPAWVEKLGVQPNAEAEAKGLISWESLRQLLFERMRCLRCPWI